MHHPILATPLPASGARSRPGLLPLPALLLLAACAAGARAQGGFYGGGRLLLGVVVAAAVIASRPGRPGRPFLTASALAGWSLVSAALGGSVRQGLPTAALVLLLHGAWHLARQSSAEQRKALVDALLALGSVVALLGLAGVALHLAPLGHLDSGTWRAATTPTYENAAQRPRARGRQCQQPAVRGGAADRRHRHRRRPRRRGQGDRPGHLPGRLQHLHQRADHRARGQGGIAAGSDARQITCTNVPQLVSLVFGAQSGGRAFTPGTAATVASLQSSLPGTPEYVTLRTQRVVTLRYPA